MSRTDEKYLRLLKERYCRASRKERSAILDEFVKTTGYHRKDAIGLLNGRQQRSPNRDNPISSDGRYAYQPGVADRWYGSWRPGGLRPAVRRARHLITVTLRSRRANG